jgi:23S rRNA pseudouridine2604 synthase
MAKENSTRLNKYISESGICSRREADKYIEQGSVFINGKRAKIGDQVRRSDKVMVNGQMIEPKREEESILIAFNKPVGVTSTTEITTKNNIVDYVNHSERIFPIGRLDKDSQGLIFLTNNGDIVNKILRAGNKHEKEYLVTVNKPVTDQFIEAMGNGVPILGETTKKCFVAKEAPFIFRIILIQGLNRQIRRMCEHFGFEVTKLERVRIMNVTLKGIPLGDWRELTAHEKAGIYKSIENSTSTKESSATKKSASKSKPKRERDIGENFGQQKKSSKSSGQSKSRSGLKSFNKPSGNNSTRKKNTGPGKNNGGPKKGKSGDRGKRGSGRR